MSASGALRPFDERAIDVKRALLEYRCRAFRNRFTNLSLCPCNRRVVVANAQTSGARANLFVSGNAFVFGKVPAKLVTNGFRLDEQAASRKFDVYRRSCVTVVAYLDRESAIDPLKDRVIAG
jgi:hypothetical protein